MDPADHKPGISDGPTSDDATLGGYLRVHDRPPAFEGPDGHPYTVSVEVERTGDPRNPYLGYLVFPRWARTGLGIVGHVQTEVLERGRGREQVERELGSLTLHDVKALLDDVVTQEGGGGDS